MFKPVSPVPLLQWRSAGVLHLVELPSLATEFSITTNRTFLFLHMLLGLFLTSLRLKMSWGRFCQSALNQHSYQVNQLISGLQVSYVQFFFAVFKYIALLDEIVCQSALSCSMSVGIAVGALAAVVVTGVICLLCWLRYTR